MKHTFYVIFMLTSGQNNQKSISYFKIKLGKLKFWFMTVHNLVVSSRLDATTARDFRTVPEDLKILSIDDEMRKKRVVYGQNWGKIFQYKGTKILIFGEGVVVCQIPLKVLQGGYMSWILVLTPPWTNLEKKTLHISISEFL